MWPLREARAALPGCARMRPVNHPRDFDPWPNRSSEAEGLSDPCRETARSARRAGAFAGRGDSVLMEAVCLPAQKGGGEPRFLRDDVDTASIDIADLAALQSELNLVSRRTSSEKDGVECHDGPAMQKSELLMHWWEAGSYYLADPGPPRLLEARLRCGRWPTLAYAGLRGAPTK